MRTEVLAYVAWKFIGVVNAHNHVGRFRVDVFQDQKIVNFELFQVRHFPNERLMGKYDH